MQKKVLISTVPLCLLLAYWLCSRTPPVAMPADRRGPHLKEIDCEPVEGGGRPLGQSGAATSGRASAGALLSAAVRGLLLVTAVRSGEGLVAGGSGNGGGCSMLSIGRKSGAAALRWSRSPGGERRTQHMHTNIQQPFNVLPAVCFVPCTTYSSGAGQATTLEFPHTINGRFVIVASQMVGVWWQERYSGPRTVYLQ